MSGMRVESCLVAQILWEDGIVIGRQNYLAGGWKL